MRDIVGRRNDLWIVFEPRWISMFDKISLNRVIGATMVSAHTIRLWKGRFPLQIRVPSFVSYIGWNWIDLQIRVGSILSSEDISIEKAWVISHFCWIIKICSINYQQRVHYHNLRLGGCKSLFNAFQKLNHITLLAITFDICNSATWIRDCTRTRGNWMIQLQFIL